VGGASLVVLVSLFLPWSGFSALGVGISISGTTAHGCLVLVVITALLITGYLLLRSGWSEFPFPLPVAHEILLLCPGPAGRSAPTSRWPPRRWPRSRPCCPPSAHGLAGGEAGLGRRSLARQGGRGQAGQAAAFPGQVGLVSVPGLDREAG
jgi:hypothetical protein